MTSANVSDVPVLMNLGQTQVQSAAKSDQSSGNFQDLMFHSISFTDFRTSNRDLNNSQQITIPQQQIQPMDAAKKIPQAAEEGPKNLNAETVSAGQDAIEEFSQKTNELLEESLDVTEEEIATAMETLGLTYLDLLNPANLTKLISELNSQDNVSLLVSDTVSNLLDQVQSLGAEMVETSQMTIETLKDVEMFTGEIVPMDGNDISQDVVNIPSNEQPMVGHEVMPQEGVAMEMQTPKDAPMDGPGEELLHDFPMDEETEVPKVLVKESNVEVDETNDLADEVEGGLKNLMKETGNTAQNETNSARDQMMGKQHSTSSQPTTPSTEAPVGPTFTATAEQVQATVERTTYTSGIDTRDIIQQIVNNAKVTISQQVTSMEMELNPQNLGRMILNVAENDGKVTAHITLQNEAVRQAMEYQMSVLKDNLNQQGIKVEAVEVSVGTHEFERNLEEGQNQPNQQQPEESKPFASTRRSNINLNQMDELADTLSEEETLVARMMKDAGNSINFTA